MTLKAHCPICQELFRTFSDISVNKCGHIFHYHCILQWYERQQTCPQCRQKGSETSLIPHIYSDPATDSSNTPETSELTNNVSGNKRNENLPNRNDLKNKINKLEDIITTKDKELKQSAEEGQKAKDMLSALKKENQELLQLLKKKDDVIKRSKNDTTIRNLTSENGRLYSLAMAYKKKWQIQSRRTTTEKETPQNRTSYNSSAVYKTRSDQDKIQKPNKPNKRNSRSGSEDKQRHQYLKQTKETKWPLQKRKADCNTTNYKQRKHHDQQPKKTARPNLKDNARKMKRIVAANDLFTSVKRLRPRSSEIRNGTYTTIR